MLLKDGSFIAAAVVLAVFHYRPRPALKQVAISSTPVSQYYKQAQNIRPPGELVRLSGGSQVKY